MFTAKISQFEYGGEVSFSAVVVCAGRTVFQWEGPTENYVQCEVLDWARRQGKTDQLKWEYPTMSAAARSNPSSIETLGSFLNKGLEAQQAADRAVRMADTRVVLNRQESEKLFDLEKVVEKGLDTFVEVGKALAEIRDSRLYRYRYSNFDDYVRDRWGMSTRHAHRLVDGAKIAENLLPEPAQASAGPELTNWSPPRTESQVRPLKGLEPEQQREVWGEANKGAAGAPVTARHVEDARERLHPKKDSWPTPNEDGVYDKAGSECKQCLQKRLGFVRLCVLQIGPDKWIGAKDVAFETGNMENTVQPLSDKLTFSTREEAFFHLVDELIEQVRPYATSKSPVHPNQCFMARKMRDWAQNLRNSLKGQQPLSLEVEMAARPEALQKIRFLAENLIKAASDLKVVTECEDRVSTKQLLHLSIALTHLKNFRGSLEQIADSKRRARAAKPTFKARRKPGGSLYVICRTAHHSGAKTFRTKAGGWANHPNKAQTFPSELAAKASIRHSWDKPMMLHRAQGLRA